MNFLLGLIFSVNDSCTLDIVYPRDLNMNMSRISVGFSHQYGPV